MLTLDQCLDRLAELDGWKPWGQIKLDKIAETPAYSLSSEAVDVRWWRHADGRESMRHPIPPTLDAVAALWPVGWGTLVAAERNDGGVFDWFAEGWPPTGSDAFREVAPTELHARAAVTVAVLEHLAKEKSNDVT